MNTAFWRRWHRWIGFPAAGFLLFSGLTCFLVAGNEFFGEAEALREATRDLVSPIDRITPQFKGDQHSQRRILRGWRAGVRDALGTGAGRAHGERPHHLLDHATQDRGGLAETVLVRS